MTKEVYFLTYCKFCSQGDSRVDKFITCNIIKNMDSLHLPQHLPPYKLAALSSTHTQWQQWTEKWEALILPVFLLVSLLNSKDNLPQKPPEDSSSCFFSHNGLECLYLIQLPKAGWDHHDWWTHPLGLGCIHQHPPERCHGLLGGGGLGGHSKHVFA